MIYTLEISLNWDAVVQAAGFEPAKHYAEDLEPSPFDHSGTPARDANISTLLILALER